MGLFQKLYEACALTDRELENNTGKLSNLWVMSCYGTLILGKYLRTGSQFFVQLQGWDESWLLRIIKLRSIRPCIIGSKKRNVKQTKHPKADC